MSSDPTTPGQEEETPVARDVAYVIEELGVGWAQARLVSLAWGAWLVAAVWLGLAPILTVFFANEMGFQKEQNATLAAASFLGLILGSGSGGLLGDSLGRRPALLLSECLLLLAALSRIFSCQFGWLVACQVFGGFAVGLGWPPSVALASEASPAHARLGISGVRNLFFSVGFVAASIAMVLDNPYYKNMHWRVIFSIATIPAALLLPISWVFLPESPVFLAKKGCHQQAREILEEMRFLNGKPEVSVSYNTEACVFQARGTSAESSWTSKVQVLFSTPLLGTTVSLIVISFTVNLINYGHQYAFPLIATNEVQSNTSPAMQSLVQILTVLGVQIVTLPLCIKMSRRSLLMLGLVIGMAGMFLFVNTGSILERASFQSIIYHVSQNSPGVCGTFGFAVIYQLAVEVYPVNLASTSVGVVLLCGKLGGLVSSYVYAMCFDWQEFYNILASMALFSLVLSLTLLNYSPWSDDNAAKKLAEETPILGAKI